MRINSLSFYWYIRIFSLELKIYFLRKIYNKKNIIYVKLNRIEPIKRSIFDSISFKNFLYFNGLLRNMEIERFWSTIEIYIIDRVSHFSRLPCALCLIKERPLFDRWDNYYGKSSAAVIFFRHLQFYFHDSPQWTTASCNITSSPDGVHASIAATMSPIDIIWSAFTPHFRYVIKESLQVKMKRNTRGN